MRLPSLLLLLGAGLLLVGHHIIYLRQSILAPGTSLKNPTNAQPTSLSVGADGKWTEESSVDATVLSGSKARVPLGVHMHALERPGEKGETDLYYSISELESSDFKNHVLYLCRDITRNWTLKGFSRYDRANISECLVDTPECGLWEAFCPAGQRQKPFRKCCVEHKKLRDTGVWVMQRLGEAGIRYFLSTGTAIGAYRHNGTIIPWDTDVDIAIFPEDAEKAKAMFKDSPVHFFEQDRKGKGMFWVHASRNGKPAGGPHIEVFYEASYTSNLTALMPLVDCRWYGYLATCPNPTVLDVWFPSGWRRYSGHHWHSGARCTLYKEGNRIELTRCQ